MLELTLEFEERIEIGVDGQQVLGEDVEGADTVFGFWIAQIGAGGALVGTRLGQRGEVVEDFLLEPVLEDAHGNAGTDGDRGTLQG